MYFNVWKYANFCISIFLFQFLYFNFLSLWVLVPALITIRNSTGIATANTNNARCIKIFGVYFRNVDGLDLNKSVNIENRCSKNVENEVKIDAERKKGIIFKFALYLQIYISVVLYVLIYNMLCFVCIWGLFILIFIFFYFLKIRVWQSIYLLVYYIFYYFNSLLKKKKNHYF